MNAPNDLWLVLRLAQSERKKFSLTCSFPPRHRLLAQSGQNLVVALGPVGPQAGRAVLDAFDDVVVAAAVLQEIQRTKAEQAVERLGIGPGVAGEIPAGDVAKETMAVFHEGSGWSAQGLQ